MCRIIFVWLSLLGAATAQAATAYAVVTRVVDGDTVWLRTPERSRIKARLHGLDAPERCQTHGAEATAALLGWLNQRAVKVDFLGLDSYHRDLVRVYVDGQDVGHDLVRQGHAWAYHWRGQASPYDADEAAARRARAGLFADPSALRPSAFRRRHGSCR